MVGLYYRMETLSDEYDYFPFCWESYPTYYFMVGVLFFFGYRRDVYSIAQRW